MAIIIKTVDPGGLLKAIKTAIDEKKIVTWSYDKDGDFTHTPDQFVNKAWLTSKIYVGELRLGILKQKSIELSTSIYAIYHGRFIETVLSHFDQKFTTALATSVKTEPDNF